MLLADGRVLVVDGAAQVAELYDPTTGTWTLTSSLPTARRYPAATLLADGTVLIVGGASRFAREYPYGPVNALATAERHEPASGTWTPAGRMAADRRGHTATLLRDGTVLVAGGHDEQRVLATAERYDAGTRVLPALPKVGAGGPAAQPWSWHQGLRLLLMITLGGTCIARRRALSNYSRSRFHPGGVA